MKVIPQIQTVNPNIVSRSFRRYLLRHWRREVYYGGRGSGKTTFVARKLILRCRLNKYFKCIYSRKVHETIRESSFSFLKTAIEELKLQHEFKISESTMKITHIATGNCFIAKGVDNAEKIKGANDPNYLWLEEITEFTEDDYTTMDKTLRSPKAENCTIITFNPVMDTHWLRSFFFSEEDQHKAHPRFGDGLMVHRTTYKDNDYIDREQYGQDLLINSKGKKNSVLVDIDGDWGMPENKDPWLYAFDRALHVSDKVRFNVTFPVYLSFDFNVDPITCVAFQMSHAKGVDGSFIRVVKEFGGKKQLHELCRDIRAFYPNSILFVTGDCNGNKGEISMQNKHDTHYTLIRKGLGLSERNMHVNVSNLLHSESRLLMNTMFGRYPSLLISESGCPNLIADCEMAEIDPKAPTHKPHQLNKDRSKGFKMDYFDCLRYFMQRYFNEFVNSNYFKDFKPKM